MMPMQEEIATDVSDNLRLRLTGAEKRRMTQRTTQNPEAYRLYLQGRFQSNKHTTAGVEKALEYFRQAIQIDPNYALAYAGIADDYQSSVPWLLSPKEGYSQAKQAAERALKINPNLAEGHVTLANIKFKYDWDWAAAEQEFKRAIELKPDDASAHYGY